MKTNVGNENQRQELFKTIFAIADQLRNKVDGWEFKSYILGFLFYRYLSQKFTNEINENNRKNDANFNYELISDNMINDQLKATLGQSKGYFIYPSQLFQNVAKIPENQIESLNEILAANFRAIEESSTAFGRGSLEGLFDDIQLNSDKLGKQTIDRNRHLLKVIKTINDLDLGDFSNKNIDVFGDAYEYLIRMYASNAGKSGGEFYTPQEVSQLLFELASVNKEQISTIYDPTCGSGSLLLRAPKEINNQSIKFYGQEVNITSYNLARMNMFLHNVHYDNFDIKCDDTLLNPQHLNQKFDIIVSNPPYSIKWEGSDNPTLLNDPRFNVAGALAPKNKADLAFIMHIVSQLNAGGQAAIVCFTGVMHRKGAEQKIRKYLVDQNLVKAIIQLPENLFYGTSISTAIMVLSKAKNDNNVIFIDASNEFQKITNNNQLNREHIAKIVNHFANQIEDEHFAKVVTNQVIASRDYDLSVNTYVKKPVEELNIDIDELEAQIEITVQNIERLRREIKEITQALKQNLKK